MPKPRKTTKPRTRASTPTVPPVVQDQTDEAQDTTQEVAIDEPTTTPHTPTVATTTSTLIERIRSVAPGVLCSLASEVEEPYLVRRPFGILPLDLGIGGGIPAGGVTEIWGTENSGKNLLANHAIAYNQWLYKEKSNVLIVCTEYVVDRLFAQMCGAAIPFSQAQVDLAEHTRGRPFDQETRERMLRKIGEVIVVFSTEAEKILNILLEAVYSDEFQLVLVDSIAAFMTDDENNQELANAGMTGAALPRLLSRFLRKLGHCYTQRPHGRPNLTSVLITNQVMAQIGGGGPPGIRMLERKGGHAIRHHEFLSIKLQQGRKQEDKQRNKLSHDVNWFVHKGKAGCPDGASGVFRYHQDVHSADYGIDLEDQAVEALLAQGIMTQSGAVFSLPFLGLNGLFGKQALIDALKEYYGTQEWYRVIYPEALRESGLVSRLIW